MAKISAFARLIWAAFVLTREGVIASLPLEDMNIIPGFGIFLARKLAKRRSKKRDRAENIACAIHKLGPSYIKFGQFLATRPDLIGKELANDLSILQDNLETFPKAQAIRQIEKTLGAKCEDIFLSLEEPIAAASMAQVHPAFVKNPDGSIKKLAVKIIRPNVRKRFAKDLESFYLMARLQERLFPTSKRLRPVCIVENLAQTTKIEMDMRLESAALSEIAENTKEDQGFRVPTIDWSRTGRDVLTMEWIEGTKISDIDTLKEKNIDLKKLACTLMQSFLRHSLRDGFFHADMHPGNIFVDDTGDIIAIDFGIVGRLGKKEKYFLAEILYGFITRDYYRVAKVHFEAGYVPKHHSIESFAQANRAIGEPIHGQSAQTISMARLLTLLFEITEIFDMKARPELLLLQKTMVVVEGISRNLDPEFNMWRTAEPVIKEWMSVNMGPIGFAKDMKESLEAITNTLRKTPEIIQKWHDIGEALHKDTENGLRMHEESLRYLSKVQKRQNRLSQTALWIIAFCLIWLTFIK